MRIQILGIDNEDVLRLCQPFVRGYKVSIDIEEGEIFLKGKDAYRVYEDIRLIFGNKVILGNLAANIIEILKKNNKKITTAESCTGGLLAYQFTSISGASNVYDGGIISYANTIKQKLLDVKEDFLKEYGAVSEMVVKDMLSGALKVFNADYALATSGIAGPNGGTVNKPVGTVYIGMQKKDNLAVVERFLFEGGREEVQKKACLKALELLAKNL